MPVQAQTGYWIKTWAISWPDLRIQINILSSYSPILRNDLSEAVGIWNNATAWFQSTYYSTELVKTNFIFMRSPNDAGVGFTTVKDVTVLEHDCNGNATIISCTIFNGWEANVEILSSYVTATNPYLLGSMVSILGGLLGLVQFPDPCPFRDLMCTTQTTIYPSTLDLYAAKMMAESKAGQIVILPANIPYEQAPVTPIPEFKATVLLAVLVLFVTTILLKRRQTI